MILEPAIGVIDGVNTEFETTTDYFPGSVRVWTPLLENLGVTELGGKDIQLDTAPLPSDVVYVWYRPIV